MDDWEGSYTSGGGLMPPKEQKKAIFKEQLTFLSVIVLVAGLFVAIIGSQQSQEQRSRASAPTSISTDISHTIWNSTARPEETTGDNGYPVELGVKFKAASDGKITGIRFYKGPNDSGTHIGNLWTSTGQLLARATFTNETASGWQQVNFATPVAITANTTYTASYFTSKGGFAYNFYYFTQDITNGPLTAFSNNIAGGNGVYMYSSTSAFPTNTYRSANYWVDVSFSQEGQLQI